MNKYPIYVISKGRWETPLTARALEGIGVPYRIVVEPQEATNYSKVVDSTKILILPFSNLGQGSIPARNWVWEHSIAEGHRRHWILDDNIRAFRRMNEGKRLKVTNSEGFETCESFVDRYTNIAMAGMQYTFLAKQGGIDKSWTKPVDFNTRIYSCILLANNVPHRWRGRYNEDTDLSIRFLKDGYCTALFYAYLIDKVRTMTMKGGNTDDLYKQSNNFDGRLEMARSLQQQHPDVTKITRKWGRWQHHVNYRPFKGNKLIKRSETGLPNHEAYKAVSAMQTQQS